MTTAQTRSPELAAHQEALKTIYTFTTPEQFDSVPALLKEKRFEILRPTQVATLLWVADNQRKLYASRPSNPTRVAEIREEYKEIDEENFWPEEVTIAPIAPGVAWQMLVAESNIPGLTPQVEEKWTEPDPALQVEPEPKTRKRRIKEEMAYINPDPTPTQWVQSVTVSRRVNLPIEWVQYSNNEFNVSVTASNREDAVNELNILLESFLADQWLVRKSIADKTIADLRAQLKAEQEKKVTPPAPIQYAQWDPELLKKHEKLRDMMNFIYKNSTNKEEFLKFKETFTSLPT